VPLTTHRNSPYITVSGLSWSRIQAKKEGKEKSQKDKKCLKSPSQS